MLIVLFVSFVVLLLIQVPVGFAVGTAALVALVVQGQLPLQMIVTRLFVAVDSFTLMAIPFFVLAGHIMNHAGITRRIVEFSQSLVGSLTGGLAHVNIVASMFFSGISGSATADSSALGSMLIPLMEEDNYPPEFAVVVTATSSTIGPVIPPSIMMVIYGVIANVSISRLFLAGIVPGVLVGVALMVMAYIISVRNHYGSRQPFRLMTVFRSAGRAVVPMMMPIIIIGGVLSGVFTATESGVVATIYALFVGMFVYRTIRVRDVPALMIKAAITTAVCLFVIATASVFGWLLAWEGFPGMIRDWLLAVGGSPTITLLMVLAFILMLGLVFEGIPVLVIFAPIFVPLMQTVGVNLVHFGVVFIMAILIGSVTPPVGILLYVGCGIAGIPVSRASKVIWPFVGMMVLVLFACVMIPSLLTYLPDRFLPVP